jgi:hypothetical protein
MISYGSFWKTHDHDQNRQNVMSASCIPWFSTMMRTRKGCGIYKPNWKGTCGTVDRFGSFLPPDSGGGRLSSELLQHNPSKGIALVILRRLEIQRSLAPVETECRAVSHPCAQVFTFNSIAQ